jgi:Icc-related predicted phosphoesterase
MKLIAIADPHFNEDRASRARAVAEAVSGADADVLVVAGDCSADGIERVGDLLALFSEFDGTRLMVPGNHDLWQHDPPFATSDVYEETLPALAAEHGFHCLDQGPQIVGETAFVGCMGWYDYTMRQREAPVEGMTVTPINVAPGDDGQPSFSAVPGAGETTWEGLEAEDYAAGGLIWQLGDATPEVAVWNDVLHVNWRRPAPEVAAEMAQRLREQVAQVAGQCRRVVGVTHFVPFAELADHRLERPRRAWARAFLGSPLLGEALREAEDLALVICGHRHRQQVVDVQGVPVADASVYADDGPLLLTLPD